MNKFRSWFGIFIFVVSLVPELQGQNLKVALNAGPAAAYLFENIDPGVNMHYDIAFGSSLAFFYQKKESYFDLGLKFIYFNAKVSGTHWRTQLKLDGEVSSLTPSFVLAHNSVYQYFNLGYQFGIGYTNENFIPNQKIPNYITNQIYTNQRNFLSLNVSGSIDFRLSTKATLGLHSGLLWMDPINSFRGAEYWQVAGEDLSILVTAGYSYKLF